MPAGGRFLEGACLAEEDGEEKAADEQGQGRF
jgi:hypothetical protein